MNSISICVSSVAIFSSTCSSTARNSRYIILTELEKNRKLNDLLGALDFNQVVVFIKSESRAVELKKYLVECNFPLICIHSGMSLKERLTRYEGFKEGHSRVLVATNLFGREHGNGVNIGHGNIVINYDTPDSIDTFLHRVGRVGSFDMEGLAITFVSFSPASEFLEKVRKGFKVDMNEIPEQTDTSTNSCLIRNFQNKLILAHEM